jgi:hypothetical protein
MAETDLRSTKRFVFPPGFRADCAGPFWARKNTLEKIKKPVDTIVLVS